MKKILLLTLLLIFFGIASNLSAQTINVVPNPSTPDLFEWFPSSSINALSGYCGSPIVLGSKIVLQYNATGASSTTNPTTEAAQQTVIQFATYDGGDTLHLIPNPTNESTVLGIYQGGPEIVFNNKLYFIYLDTNLVQKLASFDGTSITTYPNPDASTVGYIGSPRILNNQLYCLFNNVSGVYQYAKFNGSGCTYIPNPDNSPYGFRNDYSVVFGNSICAHYVNASVIGQIANFNGTSWTLLPNPDNSTTYGVVPGLFPVAYNNKLYWDYFSTGNQFQLLQYDGVNNPTLIANPEDESANNGGYAGFPIVNDDTLFIQYQNSTNAFQVAKFDGTNLTLVPNPDATTYGFWNTPIVYDNNLFIFYVTPDGLHHLGEYETASNSIKVYPNPDGGSGYWDQPITYDGNLYFIYYNAAGLSQLGYFNGIALNLITNPSGIYNSGNGNNGYIGQPIIWNNLLYMQMASIGYANSGNLGYFDGSTLPVTLLSFNAQKAGNTSLLSWVTANELNNNYFEVERSVDGKSFAAIGKVDGHGTADFKEKYQFTDNDPNDGVNYYRLKQVDLNGNYIYSNIAAVTFEGIAQTFKAFPNPAVNSVNLTLPSVAGASVIEVYDMNGKKMMEETTGANTLSQILDVSKLAAGVYQVTLIQGTQKQTVKLVKQ